jgi:hypothetical protein
MTYSNKMHSPTIKIMESVDKIPEDCASTDLRNLGTMSRFHKVRSGIADSTLKLRVSKRSTTKRPLSKKVLNSIRCRCSVVESVDIIPEDGAGIDLRNVVS